MYLNKFFESMSAQLVTWMTDFWATHVVMFTKKTPFEQYSVVAFPLAFSSDSGCTWHTSGLIYSNEQAYLDSRELFAVCCACIM